MQQPLIVVNSCLLDHVHHGSLMLCQGWTCPLLQRDQLVCLCYFARACAMSSAIACEVVSRPLSSSTTTRSCCRNTAQQRSASNGKVTTVDWRHATCGESRRNICWLSAWTAADGEAAPFGFGFSLTSVSGAYRRTLSAHSSA